LSGHGVSKAKTIGLQGNSLRRMTKPAARGHRSMAAKTPWKINNDACTQPDDRYFGDWLGDMLAGHIVTIRPNT
jgi:hypothetical protein